MRLSDFNQDQADSDDAEGKLARERAAQLKRTLEQLKQQEEAAAVERARLAEMAQSRERAKKQYEAAVAERDRLQKLMADREEMKRQHEIALAAKQARLRTLIAEREEAHRQRVAALEERDRLIKEVEALDLQIAIREAMEKRKREMKTIAYQALAKLNPLKKLAGVATSWFSAANTPAVERWAKTALIWLIPKRQRDDLLSTMKEDVRDLRAAGNSDWAIRWFVVKQFAPAILPRLWQLCVAGARLFKLLRHLGFVS